MLTRLLVLWLLSEQPLHGYRIKKILDDEALRFWFPVEYASIYSVLRSLVRGGYVESVAVEREGQRPERTRYAITPEGRRHLAELLERAWRELPPVGDVTALALAARSDLEDERRVPELCPSAGTPSASGSSGSRRTRGLRLQPRWSTGRRALTRGRARVDREPVGEGRRITDG